MDMIFAKSDFTEPNILKMIANIPDRIIIFSPSFKFIFENKFIFISEKFGVFRVDDILDMFSIISDSPRFNLRMVYYDKNIEYELTNKFDWTQIDVDKNHYVPKRSAEKKIVSLLNYTSNLETVTRIQKTNDILWDYRELFENK